MPSLTRCCDSDRVLTTYPKYIFILCLHPIMWSPKRISSTPNLSESISVSQHSAAPLTTCTQDVPCSKLQSSVTLRRDNASGACGCGTYMEVAHCARFLIFLTVALCTIWVHQVLAAKTAHSNESKIVERRGFVAVYSALL